MRIRTLLGTSMLAIAVATPAWGQETPQAEDSGNNSPDIVVTAQKRAERLQDVPLAVTAVSADALALVRPPQTEKPGWAKRFRDIMTARKTGK